MLNVWLKLYSNKYLPLTQTDDSIIMYESKTSDGCHDGMKPHMHPNPDQRAHYYWVRTLKHREFSDRNNWKYIPQSG